MRFYADEDFPKPVVIALRSMGFDILTAYDDERANLKIDDEQVLLRATALGRAVLTRNRRHFVRLHNLGVAHEGIVACTNDADVPAFAQRIADTLMPFPVLKNQLLRVNLPP